MKWTAWKAATSSSSTVLGGTDRARHRAGAAAARRIVTLPSVCSQLCFLSRPRMGTTVSRFSLNNSECGEQNQMAGGKIGGKNTGFRAKLTQILVWAFYLPFGGLWENCFTFLCLSFVICKRRQMISCHDHVTELQGESNGRVQMVSLAALLPGA